MNRKKSRKSESIYNEVPDREWFIMHGEIVASYCGGFQVDSRTGESGEHYKVPGRTQAETIDIQNQLDRLMEKFGKSNG